MMITRPKGKVDVVLDTDTYNEVDDQYALAYLIRSEDKLKLKAIYAAPFSNSKADTPDEGMEKSYQEIMNILELMDREELKSMVFKGAGQYLEAEDAPVDSPAARDLACRAMTYTAENPLYVIAIGAITNVASAILLEPDIVSRIVVIWLGGHALHWPDNEEFNLRQDIAAARVVFGCGAAMVLLPCMGVVSAFTVSEPELEHFLRGKNKLCDYLADVTRQEGRLWKDIDTWTRAIWDVTAVAWLLDERFMKDCLIHSPIPEYDHHYAVDCRRHMIRYVYHINRDELLLDLFQKLTR